MTLPAPTARILTDLHRFCRKGDVQLIAQVFRPDLVNLRDERVLVTQLGLTALACAVISGNEKATEYLLAQGANPDLSTDLGETPLHYAADNSQLVIAKLLLQRGGFQFQEKVSFCLIENLEHQQRQSYWQYLQ